MRPVDPKSLLIGATITAVAYTVLRPREIKVGPCSYELEEMAEEMRRKQNNQKSSDT